MGSPSLFHHTVRGASQDNFAVHSSTAFLHLTWGSRRRSDNLITAKDAPAIYTGSQLLESNDPEHL